jgi:hypothetical protein
MSCHRTTVAKLEQKIEVLEQKIDGLVLSEIVEHLASIESQPDATRDFVAAINAYFARNDVSSKPIQTIGELHERILNPDFVRCFGLDILSVARICVRCAADERTCEIVGKFISEMNHATCESFKKGFAALSGLKQP